MMKPAHLFKVLGDCPATLETPDSLLRHATRKRARTETNLSDRHSQLNALFALQEAYL
jgi:hypothetical protein